MRHSDFHLTTTIHYPSLLNTLTCRYINLHILSTIGSWEYYRTLPKAFKGLSWKFPPLYLSSSRQCDRCMPCQAPKRKCREDMTSMHCCFKDAVTHKDQLHATAGKKKRCFSLKDHFSLASSDLKF